MTDWGAGPEIDAVEGAVGQDAREDRGDEGEDAGEDAEDVGEDGRTANGMQEKMSWELTWVMF